MTAEISHSFYHADESKRRRKVLGAIFALMLPDNLHADIKTIPWFMQGINKDNGILTVNWGGCDVAKNTSWEAKLTVSKNGQGQKVKLNLLAAGECPQSITSKFDPEAGYPIIIVNKC